MPPAVFTSWCWFLLYGLFERGLHYELCGWSAGRHRRRHRPLLPVILLHWIMLYPLQPWISPLLERVDQTSRSWPGCNAQLFVPDAAAGSAMTESAVLDFKIKARERTKIIITVQSMAS